MVEPAIEATTNTGATWSAEAVPSGFSGDNLTNISCPATTECFAGQIPGVYDLLVLTNGAWAGMATTPSLDLDNGYLGGLDCPSASTCWVEASQDGQTSSANLWQINLSGGSLTAAGATLPTGVTGTSATCPARPVAWLLVALPAQRWPPCS